MTLARTILNKININEKKSKKLDSEKLGDKEIAVQLNNQKYIVGYGYRYYPTIVVYESSKEVTLRWAEKTKLPSEADLNFGVTFLKNTRSPLGRSYQDYKLYM